MAVLAAVIVVLLTSLVVNTVATNRLLSDFARVERRVCVLQAHSIRQRYSQETPGQNQAVIRTWYLTGTCVGGVVRRPPPP